MPDTPNETIRLKKLGRVVGYSLAVLSIVFAIQTLLVCSAMPTFLEMFASMGARLPWAMRGATDYRFVWLALAVGGVAGGIARWKRGVHTRRTVFWLGVLALAQFVLAQAVTAALFLPVDVCPKIVE